MKNIIPILLITLLATGCSMPFKNPIFEPNDARFKGLETSMTTQENNAATLIMIHGMCNHDKNWVVGNQKNFAKSFGYQVGGLEKVLDGGLAGVSAYRADLFNDHRRIALYGIVYAPVSLVIKQTTLCRYVSKPTDVCPFDPPLYSRTRASINAEAINGLMNDCLADAIVYQGPAGKTMREGVRSALIEIQKNRSTDREVSNSPLFLYSESLGSKVLRDAVLCAPDDRAASLLSMLSNTSQAFLAANQIPFLNLGHEPPECNSETSREVLQSLAGIKVDLKGDFSDLLNVIDAMRAQKSGKSGVPNLTGVVAFTDPNDLLSYEIDPSDYGNRSVVNGLISNDRTWFGLIENPYTAHTGYKNNPSVLNHIRCGRNIPAMSACAE
ncbi:hypothetical protein [Candidatus Thiodiazotropha sp. LNASS1]|uniref:hypothetical protein n=1 Tax=Candidatus Thiodiazotropha sp. LNASS1 TaxID=3096260 RepID=UPI0034DF9DF0